MVTINARNLRRVGLVAAACALLASAGCTSRQPGVASPATASSGTASNAPSTGTQDVFAGAKACDVLDELVAGQGFSQGENKTARNECVVSKPDYAGIAIALDPVQGLAEFTETDPGAISITVNGRPALQADEGYGNCIVAIEVAEHARALVTVTTTSTSSDGCAVARQWAEALEPKLPKQ